MLISNMLTGLLKFLIGVTARWKSEPNLDRQKIYFANHTSHMDTLAIIAALPREARLHVRPIAAADYWGKNAFLRFISQRCLNAVLIDRCRASADDPLAPVISALHAGNSIIYFPEGTRSSESLPGAFKGGLHRLSMECPEVDLVPVYLENVNRSMPKGKHLPLPIICTIRIGDPLARIEGEHRHDFLERARAAVVELSI